MKYVGDAIHSTHTHTHTHMFFDRAISDKVPRKSSTVVVNKHRYLFAFFLPFRKSTWPHRIYTRSRHYLYNLLKILSRKSAGNIKWTLAQASSTIFTFESVSGVSRRHFCQSRLSSVPNLLNYSTLARYSSSTTTLGCNRETERIKRGFS